jgi:SET domain-containing protein
MKTASRFQAYAEAPQGEPERPSESYLNNAPKCVPGRSRIHGAGLFAKAKIKAGEAFMTLPAGKIVPAASYLENEAGLLADEWNALSEKELLVRTERTWYYFINHQCIPNAIIDIARRRVVALADLVPNAEITLDYLREPLPRIYFETRGAAWLKD